jgi:hypothetical protein
MIKPKDKIYIQQWLDLKPYDKQTTTDGYYLNLSNKVKQAILSNQQSYVLLSFIDSKQLNILSCFLTSYFEDIISDTQIWNTFVKEHQQLYHKPLPFYDIEEYYENEINLKDICFLICYFLNTIQHDKFIAPINSFIDDLATVVFEVFDEAWDDAPENETLKKYYKLDNNESDYYNVRILIDNILFKTYLFYPDTALDLRDSEHDVIKEYENENHLLAALNENRDITLHTTRTKLLALSGKEWAAKILGSEHPLHHDILNISKKILSSFLYKGQNDTDVFIEHIATGRKFNLTKKSFSHFQSLTKVDTILHIGIIQWKNEWWFSGTFFTKDFDANLILDEKNSVKSRMAVNFLDDQKYVEDYLEKQFKAFVDFTNGRQIAFVESDKINDFMKNYTEYYNETLGLTEEEKTKAKKQAKANGFFGGIEKSADFSDKSAGSGLVFFNPKSGPEIALSVNSAFPVPYNPFFNEAESDEHVLGLLLDRSISKELSLYCIENHKSELHFFKGKEGMLYLKDIDFWLRFWKNKNYISKPSVTITGSATNILDQQN